MDKILDNSLFVVGRKYYLKYPTPSKENMSTSANNLFSGIRQIAAAVHKTAVAKGFWDKEDMLLSLAPESFKPFIVAAKLALIHSEVSEALEEQRDNTGYIYFVADKDGEMKPEGIAIELADAVIRVFDLSAWLGIDVAESIRLKMLYNMGRQYRHGGKAL